MKIHPHLIPSESTLLQALIQLNALPGGTLTLFVTDSEGRLTGTLTDGDIRRALAAGKGADSPVSEAMFTAFKYISEGCKDISRFSAWRQAGINLVPVVDEAGKPVDMVDIGHGASRVPMRALLMAGGKGERLRPMTLTTPKPLLHIEDKAIIDYNTEALRHAGVSEIYVSTGYMADKIREHFAGTDIRCIEETEPLGTVGAAAMLPPSQLPTLVMNSDLLTNISFEDMYVHHQQTCADLTIAVIPYKVKVPYAILGFDQHGNVTSIEEKPTYAYSANAGIYIFSPRVLELLTAGVRTDATDLVQMAVEAGMKVSHFPINGTWIDIGTPDDFRQAGELMRNLKTYRTGPNNTR